MDVSFGYGGSLPTWQDAVKQFSQYDLEFPVARVWAAFSKDLKELKTKKEVKALGVTQIQLSHQLGSG